MAGQRRESSRQQNTDGYSDTSDTGVTTENVYDTIRVTAETLSEAGITDPSLGVVGVNPHAGDGDGDGGGGVIGTLDDEEIAPAIECAREDGIDAEGSLPPDSAFNLAFDDRDDCVVAMYHDRGHTPLFVNSHIDGVVSAETSGRSSARVPRALSTSDANEMSVRTEI